MKIIIKITLFIAAGLSLFGFHNANAALINAASCSQSAVQSAVNQAQDGDVVTIPDGSCTWTSGIETTKQIIIRAESYIPTSAGTEGAGAMSRNVVLTNSLSSDNFMFSFTSGNDYQSGIGGVQFNEGGSTAGFVQLIGSGSKPPIIFECFFHNINVRGWPVKHAIEIKSLGAIMWNTVMVGTSLDHVGEGAIRIYSPRPWQTNSTMGADDTNGNVNVYFEDCTFINLGICPDIDDNGRFVARHSVYDGSWAETHGFTSNMGGRHWEFYDNIFQQTTWGKNLASRYFWARAGTGVFTDNEVNLQVDPGYYGYNIQLDIGDSTTPGNYPHYRQPGWGWEDGSNVSDPIYIWNQTGTQGYEYSFRNGWDSIVQVDRDIFVNNGAKPGYSKYIYPHPLRGEQQLSCGDGTCNGSEDCSTCPDDCGVCPRTFGMANFVALLADWLTPGTVETDVNSDNIVNARDLGVMMSNWE